MITIKLDGADRINSFLGGMSRQIPFATALALTMTAKAIEQRLQKEMTNTFDRPAPWIAKYGTYTKRADKASLTAEVGIKERQSLYVREHFFGGARGQKPYEKKLRGMGILPAGYRAVPGPHMKVDSRGIPNRAQLAEIFGSLRSGMGIHKKRGKTAYRVNYFVIHVGASSHLAPGIWWRSGRAIRPVLLFVSRAAYRKVMDIERIGHDTVKAEFSRIMHDALDRAIKTAR